MTPRKPLIPPPSVRLPTRTMAPHVRMAAAQAKLAAPPSSHGSTPHVQAAVAQARLPSPPAATVHPPAPQGRVAAVPSPLKASVILRMQEETKRVQPTRVTRMVASQVDTAFSTLASAWKKQIKAGSHNSSVDLTSSGKHSCAARLTYRIGYAAPDAIEGTFDSDGCHAEMSALQNYAKLGKPGIFELMQIETQPCPRCAVVLNRLGLAAGVYYKDSGGYKDYPTWRFPEIGVNWAVVMGVADVASHEQDQKELLGKFASSKWWS